jgi:hypothetical protein
MKMGKHIQVKLVGDGYEVTEEYRYYSPRYNRWLTIEGPTLRPDGSYQSRGFYSDGATHARDLENTDAWIIHDHICRYAKWDDGTPIDNWTASTVLADLLWRDGYRSLSVVWWWGTYLGGGGAARKNGMRRVVETRLGG